MLAEEPITRRRRAYQDHVDVRVQRDPRIAEQPGAHLFECDQGLIAKPVEGVAQWPSPALVPAGLAAAAPAVAAPAFEPVHAAPRRVFGELDLPGCGDLGPEFGVVREARAVPALLDLR